MLFSKMKHTLGPACWLTNAGAEVTPWSNFKDQNIELSGNIYQNGRMWDFGGSLNETTLYDLLLH